MAAMHQVPEELEDRREAADNAQVRVFPSWFKVVISITNLKGPKMYRSGIGQYTI